MDGAGGQVSVETIAACQRGDRDALRAVYETHKDRVYSIALHYFHGNPAAAADVTQQVFLKVMKDIGKYRRDASFSTWLYRIVVNTCIDGTRRSRSASQVDDGSTIDSVVDPAASHEDLFARREMAQSIQAAIAELPPKLRLAILLRYFDDLAYTDMASALNCSVGTVSSRLSRAHRLLAERLAPLRSVIGFQVSGRKL